MSEQGFRGVPGVPEGWELVAIRRAEYGDFYIRPNGSVCQWVLTYPSGVMLDIIRKIEQQAKYRPFESAEEAEPFFDRKLRFKDGSPGLFRVVWCGDHFVRIGAESTTYHLAFSDYICDDGTPFGVKIDE